MSLGELEKKKSVVAKHRTAAYVCEGEVEAIGNIVF